MRRYAVFQIPTAAIMTAGGMGVACLLTGCATHTADIDYTLECNCIAGTMKCSRSTELQKIEIEGKGF